MSIARFTNHLTGAEGLGSLSCFILDIGLSHAHVDRFLDHFTLGDDMVPVHNPGLVRRMPDAVYTSHFKVTRIFTVDGLQAVMLVACFFKIYGHAFLAVPIGMIGPVEDEAGGGRCGVYVITLRWENLDAGIPTPHNT